MKKLALATLVVSSFSLGFVPALQASPEDSIEQGMEQQIENRIAERKFEKDWKLGKDNKPDFKLPKFPKPDFDKPDWKPKFPKPDHNKPDWKPNFPKPDYNKPDWKPNFPKPDYNKPDRPDYNWPKPDHNKPSYPKPHYPKPDHNDSWDKPAGKIWCSATSSWKRPSQCRPDHSTVIILHPVQKTPVQVPSHCQLPPNLNNGEYILVDCTVYPVCASPDSDPDGDSWGWEKERSCKVLFNYCQGFTDPDGDGWGWENEQSCIMPG